MTYQEVWIEPYSGYWFLWALAPLVLVGFGIAQKKGERAVPILAGFGLAIIVWAMVLLMGANPHNQHARLEALEKAGYTNVSILDGVEFIASDQFGDYVHGKIVPLEGNFHIVVRLDREVIEP